MAGAPQRGGKQFTGDDTEAAEVASAKEAGPADQG